jgi:hypothetical protein
MRTKKPINPFYVLLVIVGTAFVITACAYGVTAMRALRPVRAVAAAQEKPNSLIDFMSKHGEMLLVGELLVLAVATVGAISTDGYWARKANEPKTPDETDRP